MKKNNYGPGNTLITRRRMLKGAASIPALPIIPSLIFSSQTAVAQTGSCGVNVRSSWAYYPLDNGLGLDQGNESLPPLQPLSNDPQQWLDNNQWWTGNGTDRSLEVPWDADELGFDELADPTGDAYLLGFEMYMPTAPSGSEVLFSLGQNFGNGFRPGIELRTQADDLFYVYLRDDAGQTIVLRTHDKIHSVSNGNLCVFLFIDGRAKGSRTADIYLYNAGTNVHATKVRPKSISTLSPLSGGTLTQFKKISIGAAKSANDTPILHFNGQIRRLNIFNFRNTPPANLAEIMDALSVNFMQPVVEMDGI